MSTVIFLELKGSASFALTFSKIQTLLIWSLNYTKIFWENIVLIIDAVLEAFKLARKNLF